MARTRRPSAPAQQDLMVWMWTDMGHLRESGRARERTGPGTGPDPSRGGGHPKSNRAKGRSLEPSDFPACAFAGARRTELPRLGAPSRTRAVPLGSSRLAVLRAQSLEEKSPQAAGLAQR